MRRSALVLALLASLTVPADAQAQTPVPNPVCVVANCHEEDDKEPRRTSCPVPATIVCAGGALIDGVGSAAQAGVGLAGDAVMGGLTSWVAGGAAWLLQRAGQLLDRSTRPALGSTWFRARYRTMVELAVALSLLFLVLAVLHAVLRQDARALARSAMLALPLALLLCFAAVTLVETALAMTDWLTARVLQRFERDTAEFFSDAGGVLGPASISGSPLPGFLLFLGALLTALATFVVWLELVMREAAVYLAVAFLPLSFSAMIWERTAHWCRRMTELLIAVVLAKLTIAVAISVAAGAMGHARSGEGGLTALMAGSAVMLIAALTPFLLLRLIPVSDAAAYMALRRGAAKSALAAAPGAQTGAMVVRQFVLRSAAAPATQGPRNLTARQAAAPTVPQPSRNARRLQPTDR